MSKKYTQKTKKLFKKAFEEYNKEQTIDFEQEDEFDDIMGEIEEVQFAQKTLKRRRENPDA